MEESKQFRWYTHKAFGLGFQIDREGIMVVLPFINLELDFNRKKNSQFIGEIE